MRDWIKRAFSFSQSRWGLITVILSTSNLVLAVVVMYPFIPEAPIWAKVFFGLAMFGFGTAIALGLY